MCNVKRRVGLLWVGMMLVVFSGVAFGAEELVLGSPFGDNMVLQRDLEIPIWGWDKAGQSVQVRMGDHEATAVADADGAWRVTLPAMSAGGPFVMEVAGSSQAKFTNVMVGEVWICSGQSNMEMPVKGETWGVYNGDAEVAAANHPNIRLFRVWNKIAYTPQVRVANTGWKCCAPDAVEDFSATAYFFGRHLSKHMDCAIGLIETCWGGTPAEAWTSKKALSTMADYRDTMVALEKASKNVEAYFEQYRVDLAAWKERLDKRDQGMTEQWMAVELSDSDWPTMQVPGLWEKAGWPGWDGFMWYRKEVELPASWAGKDVVVHLGPINDYDRNWFNGEFIGQFEEPDKVTTQREYKVKGEWVKAGRNVLAVRVFDRGGQGGLFGEPEVLWVALASDSDGKRIPLAGEWRCKPSLSLGEEPQPTPLVRPNWPHTPTVLNNAMIQPLVPYAIRGAIWYQGESNASRAYQYRTLFPLMIEDWRQDWGQGDFPFLFVQLANFMARADEPGESTWAELREAQLMTLEKPNTGMAVIIDIGDAEDIHPRNKQDVGKRLGLAARHVAYGEDIVYSGPIYTKMQVEKDSVRLHFDHVGAGLVAKEGAALTGFAIAGADKQFVWADARIDGDTVVVRSDKVADPVAVRYAWADNPACTLFNAEGLPASPFRTDTWLGITVPKK